MTEDPRAGEVLVLGAGVAGLAAAQALRAAGRRVTVIEARERLGGRVFTVRVPSSPLPVELGAEFAHGAPESIATIARQASLTLCDAPWAMVNVLDGKIARVDGGDMGGPVEALVEQIKQEAPGDVSIASFLGSLIARDATWRERSEAVLGYVRGFHAADPARMSVLALLDEEQARDDAAGEDQRILDGYDAVVAALADGLDPARLRLRSVARQVTWERGRVSIEVESSGVIEHMEAPCAVIALPLGVLRAPPGEVGAVRFCPPPGQAREAIDRLAFGDALHVALCFDEPFWESLPGEQADAGRDLSFFRVPGAPIAVWWTKLPARTAVLTGWAGGPDATALARRPDEEVLGAALASLGRAFGMPVERLRARLRSWHHHDWAADPFARGAYSYVPVGGIGAQAALCEPVEDTLFFAGEAAHAGGDTGTVHGAIESGRRAARQILGRAPG